jgi:photosystem I subunit VI
VAVRAGEDKYFDLKEMKSTVGAWDMYGKDDEGRYNQMQAKFFENATDGVSRREALRGVLAIGGLGSILIWGGKGAKDANLPITKGPQQKAEPGPRGRI